MKSKDTMLPRRDCEWCQGNGWFFDDENNSWPCIEPDCVAMKAEARTEKKKRDDKDNGGGR